MDERFLIKNTTREQRKQIVTASLDLDLSGHSDCAGSGLGDPLETYKAYIDGEKELSQINAELGNRH